MVLAAYFYFTSLPIVSCIVIAIFAMLLFYTIFRSTVGTRVRCWSLGLVLVSSLFMWLFVSISLILCFSFLRTNPTETGIRAVFGNAVLIAMGATLPLSIALRLFAPRILLRSVRGLHPANRNLKKRFTALARQMQVHSPELQLFNSQAPISFTVETAKPTVVISDRLLSLLTADEIEAVMAHEFAHIKNYDTSLKSLITAYRTVFPFDPIIRMVEAAFHREREMLADECAVRATKKPLSLASALMKIHHKFPRNEFTPQGIPSLLGAGASLTRRYPTMSSRIDNLMRLAEGLSAPV